MNTKLINENYVKAFSIGNQFVLIEMKSRSFTTDLTLGGASALSLIFFIYKNLHFLMVKIDENNNHFVPYFTEKIK